MQQASCWIAALDETLATGGVKMGNVFMFSSLLSSPLPSLLFLFPYGAVAVNTYLNSVITY